MLLLGLVLELGLGLGLGSTIESVEEGVIQVACVWLGLGLGSTIERVEEGVVQVRHKAAALVWRCAKWTMRIWASVPTDSLTRSNRRLLTRSNRP